MTGKRKSAVLQHDARGGKETHLSSMITQEEEKINEKLSCLSRVRSGSADFLS